MQQAASSPSPGAGNASRQGPAVEELDVYGDVPMARFGHTITLVSKTKVVLFGGATGDTGKYSMTGETYLFNILTKTWSKLNGKINMIFSFKFSKGSSSISSCCTFFNKC
jgi:hypothetical protein